MALKGSSSASTDAVSVQPGQSIQFIVLNSDGTVSATVETIALPIPAGQTMDVVFSYSGTLK